MSDRRIGALAGLLVVGLAAAAAGQQRLPPPPPPPPEGAPSTPALLRLLDGKGEVIRVDTGYQATDGVVWTADNVLIFTDPPRGQVLRWTGGGQPAMERGDSGGASGLALDATGLLIEAERAARRVVRLGGSEVTILLDRVDGAPLGGPTDVAVASGGALYVADTTASGGRIILVPSQGAPAVVASDLQRPAGLALSIDGGTLYATDAGKAELRAYAVEPDGRLGPGRQLAQIAPWKHGVFGRPGGLALDREGRIYLAGPGGIWVLDAHGGRLGVIATPETPSACTFGDKDHKTLYLTAENSVYKVRLTVAGAH
jgi:sugar lactone lactonase YvrE